MEAFRSCRFCEIVVGKFQYAEIDEPFMSNDDFMAVASIGALVTGWSLIIPKAHQLSMRNIYGKSAFLSFLGSVLPFLSNRYGSLIAFEHGSNKEGSLTACGTDHAHLHLVPFGESLLPELGRSGLQWIKCHAGEIGSKAGEREYLFYSDLDIKRACDDPVGYLHILEHPLSQFFRRLIANRLRKTDIFDYRLYPQLDTARETRRMLAGAEA
jgi:ATP adenylyltransferase